MLQVDVRHFASDALEDAMRLAQTKALNSYTFSDCLSHLNYVWSDIYSKMACIDDGYYGVNIKLTDVMTKLPPFVKSSVQVYSAQSPTDRRYVYRSAGTADLGANGTYKISGYDLYCPDVKRTTVWLYFVPACPQIFFTHHNRDPKIYDEHETKRNNKFNLYTLYGTYKHDGNYVDVNIKDCTRDELLKVESWYLENTYGDSENITDIIKPADLDLHDGAWHVCYISCDYPYIFVSYVHDITGEHISGFVDQDRAFNQYNPFAFTGRNSDVEYISCKWNDKTGMGVIIKDYNDTDSDEQPRIKELGWTPDTRLDYPAPEMYRYLVARLADKLSALNESNVMGVQKELAEAEHAFNAFIDKDKSSWKRIINVNPPTIGDWL